MAALGGRLGQSRDRGPTADGAAANRWLVLAIVLACADSHRDGGLLRPVLKGRLLNWPEPPEGQALP
jgi:hypothetical protein